MPVAPDCPLILTSAERERLKKAAYGHKTPYQARQRAVIVLHAARGRSNARIARETGLHLDTVRTWRGRFAHGGMPALADRKRTGRPARFTPVQVAEAKALACQLPAETGTPLSRWSCPELAAELTARGITDTVSASTVRRWLRQDALKPWQYRSWIFIRDPDFRTRAQRVLDLYARTYEGEPLGADEYVISSDEKTSIQARCRCHSTLAPGQARAMRVNDVHQAKVLGRCEPTTGIVPFMALVQQVITQDPYARAKRVFWIVDNGSSHRGKRAIDRLAKAFPNAVMVHTPVHASWLNQVEIFFTIVQRKVITPNDFTDLTQVWDRLRAVDLLCIDELGYMELDRHGAELLFQVLTEREEKNSVAIASNESFGGWTKTFTDPRLCAAIVDRLTFNGTIIETGTDSYRLASTRAKANESAKAG